LNTKTIIVGLGGLLLAIGFILFKSQFFAFLYSLARRETKPWAWYQKLKVFLLLPVNNFINAFLPNGNFSFREAYGWSAIASVAFWFLYSIILWLKFSFPINITTIFKLLKECLFAGLFLPIGILLLTGIVHFLAKLFRSKGTFQRFFITYIAYNARPLIIYVATLFIWTIFQTEVTLYLYVICSFFLLFIPITAAIKTNYRFNSLASFFIGLFVQLVLFLSFAALFFILNPSIING
jgi:hypothetical protein